MIDLTDNMSNGYFSQSHPDWPAWKAFDKKLGGGQGWSTNKECSYGNPTLPYTEIGNGFRGEWIKIQ